MAGVLKENRSPQKSYSTLAREGDRPDHRLGGEAGRHPGRTLLWLVEVLWCQPTAIPEGPHIFVIPS